MSPRRIYAESVKATPFIPRPAHSPEKPYPYFIKKINQLGSSLTTLSPQATRFTPERIIYVSNEAFNPDTWWNANMRNKRPWVTEVESPYKNWPNDRLQQGILV